MAPSGKKKTSGVTPPYKHIKKVEDCLFEVSLPKQTLYLVGTAHVSKASMELVERVIKKQKPDTVFLELDKERKNALTENSFKKINLLQIIKQKRTPFFIAYLVLSIFQKKIAEKTGVQPGGEFKRAIEIADEKKLKVELIDREANTTIKRVWRKMRLWEQIKLIFSFVLGSEPESKDEKNKLDEMDEVEAIEKLKESDSLTEMIEKVGLQFPTFKTILIDERDTYMSEKLIEHYQMENNETPSKKVASKKKKTVRTVGVAVVGAGHLGGMLKNLDKFAEIVYFSKNKEKTDKSKSKKSISTPSESAWLKADFKELNHIPPPNLFWKMFPWVFTALIVTLFVTGFLISDNTAQFKDAIVYWIIINGTLSSLGGILALAHPVTIITCFIAAPITSLNPMIGAGVVTSLVQILIKPPQVTDFEHFSTDMMSLKKWWSNRITKVLLVFVFSSMGSALGTWLAIPIIIKTFL